jgi:hypothetical protein
MLNPTFRDPAHPAYSHGPVRQQNSVADQVEDFPRIEKFSDRASHRSRIASSSSELDGAMAARARS